MLNPARAIAVAGPIGQSKRHVEPHQVIADVSSGHGRNLVATRTLIHTRSTATTSLPYQARLASAPSDAILCLFGLARWTAQPFDHNSEAVN
jgi:hypothetical protein